MRVVPVRHLVVCLGLACLAAGSPARAADEPWLEKPFEAEPRAALRASAAGLAGETEENSPWFRLLLDEARWSLDADGRFTLKRRRVLRILTHEGAEEMGDVSASWKPWLEEAPVLRARIVRPNGAVLLLDEKTITETPASSDALLFDDRRVRRAPLPGVEPGALVEWEVVTRRTSAPLAGTLGSHAVAYPYPVGRIRCLVEAPASLPFTWKSLGIDLPPRSSLSGGKVVRLWERVAVPPLPEAEESLPLDVASTPVVEFSTGTSWGDVASRYRTRVEARLGEGPVPADALPRGPFPSRLHEAAALAEWVRREVRYTGLLFGEGAVVPASPAEVARRKFGDCKDQATLLVAALRARGFDAAVALLRAGEEPDVTSALPSLEAFDHAIVQVSGLRGEGLFIDTTSRFERLGEVPVHLQGRLALVCRPGVTGLVRIPIAAAAANTSRTEVAVRIPEAGPPKVTERTVYGGAFESSRREKFDGMTEADRKAFFDAWAEARFGGGTVLKGTVSAPRDLSAPLALETEVEKPGFVQAGDERVTFSLAAGGFLGNLPDPGEGEREHDLVAIPVRQEFEYTLVPPPGFAPADLPPADARNLGPATFTLSAEAGSGGRVALKVVVELKAARLTPAEAGALREALATLREAEPIAITFQHEAEVAAAHGELSKGLEILRGEIRRSPEKAAPHRRLARLYLASGLGDAARAEAREAVRKEPLSPRAWYLLGFVLEHDSYGRLRRTGWSPVEAEKALRKAIELDPKDVEVRFELAILLEHDLRGARYADPARLALSITEYKLLLEKAAGITTIARNYAYVLLRAERPADAVTFLEKRSDAGQMLGLRIAGIAATRGAPKALELLRRDSPEPGGRRTAAFEIGGLLLLLRRYPEAEAFLVEASRGGDGAAAAAVQAETARQLRKFEAPFPQPAAGDPVSVVRAFLAETFTAGADVERLGRLFVASVRDARDSAGKSLLSEWIRAQTRSVARLAETSGIPPAFLRDSVLSTRLTAEGSAEKGWLVTGTMNSAGQGPTRIRVWVAEEGGLPRIVSDDERARLLCWYVLGLASKGDLSGAREWLERGAIEVERNEEETNLLLDPLLPRLRPAGDAGAREIRAAAIAGLAAALPDPILAEARAFQREKPEDPLRAALLYRALVSRTSAEGDRADEAARALLQEALGLLAVIRPDRATAETAALFDIGLRGRLGRAAEACAAAEEHARTHPGCRSVGASLVTYRLAAGDGAGALEAADRLMSRPAPSASDANTAAWARYVAGKTDEKTLELARQAVEGTRRSRPAVLNTLAVICAELGRNEEAHALVVRSMDLEGLDEPFPGDWLAVGRIRENFGLVDEALAAYAKLSQPGGVEPLPDSVEALGARRARALAAGAKKRS